MNSDVCQVCFNVILKYGLLNETLLVLSKRRPTARGIGVKKPTAGTISSFITALVFGSLFYYVFGVWGFVVVGLTFAAWMLYGVITLFNNSEADLNYENEGESGYDLELDASLKDGEWTLLWSYDDNDYTNLAEIYSSEKSSTYRLILSDTIPVPRGVQFDGFYESLDDAKAAAQDFVDAHLSDD